MKSSITTMSLPCLLDKTGESSSVALKRTLPLVIRTKKTRSPASNPTPKKERLSLGVVPGRTKRLNSSEPLTSKYSIFVMLSRSTSVKTAPNPSTVADVGVPGTKKSTSVILLSKAVKSRSGLKVLKIRGRKRLILPNSTGVFVGLSVSALEARSWGEEDHPTRGVDVKEARRQQVR